MISASDLAQRFTDAFASDHQHTPPMTLRGGNAVDDCREAPSYDPAQDNLGDDYLEKYCWSLPFLDSKSWRYYLPVLAHLAIRNLSSNCNAVDAFISSLRPPDRDPPRLASLTPPQEVLIIELLEYLAFSPESNYSELACHVLEEWWLPNSQYRTNARGES